MTNRIVLAISGNVEHYASIARLAATFDAEVVAMTLDIGQGGQLEAIRRAAVAAGAVRAHVLDVREEFARQCIVGSLATEESGGLQVIPAPARALVARKLVEVAHVEGAPMIAHGGDAADHAAIQAIAQALDGSICVMTTRDAPPTAAYTVHTTLWGRSIQCDARLPIEDLPEAVYSLTAPSDRLADMPANLELSFEGGIPVAVNGVPMTLTELIESVTTIAGNHGVGRVADAATGIACEVPAAVVFHAARQALGRAAMQASAATVRVELFKGHHRIVSAHHS